MNFDVDDLDKVQTIRLLDLTSACCYSIWILGFQSGLKGWIGSEEQGIVMLLRDLKDHLQDTIRIIPQSRIISQLDDDKDEEEDYNKTILEEDEEQRRKDSTHKQMALEDAEEEEDDFIEEIKSTKSSESEKETIEDRKELEKTSAEGFEKMIELESQQLKEFTIQINKKKNQQNMKRTPRIEDEAENLLKQIEKWFTKNEIVELKMIEEKLKEGSTKNGLRQYSP
ncbi:hypothetical protein BY996DRAFT_6608583 [Phakopsora pachyrhizi]|nr:hypothetical protein BY996DRAFT_6608583 [Phakopsora pachyrhizi]